MAENEVGNVYWNSKKGQWWIKKIVDTEQGPKEMPVGPCATHGPKPTNIEVMQSYVAYVNRAMVKTQELVEKGVIETELEKFYIDQVVSAHHFNIKQFIKEELGFHYSSFQVKQILKKAKDIIEKEGRPNAYQFLELRTGPRGAGMKKSNVGVTLASIYSSAILHKPALARPDAPKPEAVIDQPESVINKLAEDMGVTANKVIEILAKQTGGNINVVKDK
jgi:hypothetical protein